MRKVFAAVLLASLSLSACNEKSVKSEQLARVVWSDDNSEQALVVLRYDQQEGMNPAAVGAVESNFTHQIYVQNADGSNRRPVGIEFQGQSGHEVYYMKSAGYIVASLMEAADNNPVARYYQLRLDGTINRLTEKPHMQVIPSPDGAYLARITQYPDTCANPAGNCPLDIEILDAQTLSKLGQKYPFSFSSQPEVTWMPDGKLVATDGQLSEAIEPGSDSVEEISPPACTYPPTSSSAVSHDGSFIFAQAGQIQLRPAGLNEKAFGCQSN